MLIAATGFSKESIAKGARVLLGAKRGTVASVNPATGKMVVKYDDDGKYKACEIKDATPDNASPPSVIGGATKRKAADSDDDDEDDDDDERRKGAKRQRVAKQRRDQQKRRDARRRDIRRARRDLTERQLEGGDPDDYDDSDDNEPDAAATEEEKSAMIARYRDEDAALDVLLHGKVKEKSGATVRVYHHQDADGDMWRRTNDFYSPTAALIAKALQATTADKVLYEWQDDDGKWEPYPPSIQYLLSRMVLDAIIPSPIRLSFGAGDYEFLASAGSWTSLQQRNIASGKVRPVRYININ